uniref:TrbI n=1 Tax=Rhizobium meliloti TaxID=382 RepID=Q6T1G0_RHIML|nr:TrbI [Sinorhizobium meliloti]
MVQSLQLGASSQADDQKGMRRLNRLPIILAIIVIVLFIGIVVIGLSWRGLYFNRSNDIESVSNTPATSFGDQLKRGVTDGIIGEPVERQTFSRRRSPSRRSRNRSRLSSAAPRNGRYDGPGSSPKRSGRPG